MILSASVFLLVISTSLALNCNGPADIVVAVPASKDVPDSEFQHIEAFLVNVTRYFSLPQTQIGLILYGNDTEVISGLKSKLNSFETNTRITLLSQRYSYNDTVSGSLDVAGAIRAVHEMLTLNGRQVATKIGVIMTYGGLDHVTTDNETDGSTVDEILLAAGKALGDDVKLYATATNGSIPFFQNITQNTCRLFSFGSMANLKDVVPYIASSMCYLIDGSVVSEQPNNCFPELKQTPPVEEFFSCPATSVEYLPDPTNCAYWYYCVGGSALRQACPAGTLFDASALRCDYKNGVSCFTEISCPEPFGMFNHPSDCSKFLNCFDNIPHVMACPGGTLFNAERGYCDFEVNVQCPVVSV
ncbi:uncharacterized protein LOC121367716 [Gigantopelta aegis]|uniref:uncharacterized protein LOC121367716 n=1 Tax=Gigantopelta aegis TaxID=1735272 RepID=UPI001B88A53F|nr:uncharacterized protein LOC121367716 [Gigantopelta aegis]